MSNTLNMEDLSEIRDAVPHLDLGAIRSLRRAGFDIVRQEPEPARIQNLWHHIPRPMTTSALLPAATGTVDQAD
ncbi:MAG: hypothetical protein ACRYGI_16160 [Janthinobacterium lividum]